MDADDSSVRAAREAYFAANGFSESSYTDNWVSVGKLGPLPLGFPNTASRKRAIPMHDLHHVATGYETTWIGEGEIGAWEIAGGCTDHAAAWVLNAAAFGFGLVVAPRRIYRAFIRGRHSRTLYHLGWSESLLELSVADLKRRLRVDREPRATWRDRLVFAAWILLVSTPTLLAAAVVAAVLAS
jgi:hypothetical protein